MANAYRASVVSRAMPRSLITRKGRAAPVPRWRPCARAHLAGVARAMLKPGLMKRALFVVFLLGCPLIAGRLGGAPAGDGAAGPLASATPQRISALARTMSTAHQRSERAVRVVPSAAQP